MTPNPEDRIDGTDDLDLDFEPVKAPKSKSGGRNWGLVIASLIVIIIVGGGGWFIYGSQFQSPNQKSVPIVRADVTPTKVKPADPGGMEVPDRDKLVYNSLKGEGAGTTVERLLPPPEELLNKPEATIPETNPPEPATEAVIAQTPPTLPTEPEKVAEAIKQEPVSLEPVTLEPQSSTEELVEEKTKQADQAVAEVAPPPAPEPEPESIAEVTPTVSDFASVPVVTTTESSTVAAALTTDANAFHIQLAALRTDERAKKEWKRLKKAFPDILGTMKLVVVRVDLGEDKGIFYRLRAGPLASKLDAKAACDKLTKLNQGCLVIRPGK
jgi:hypothetical protein